jgi:hypothetical protein
MTKRSPQVACGSRAAKRGAGLVLLVSVFVSSTALAVSMSVVSPPPVRQSGDTASVCVELNSAGDSVVGTENELFWSNACASIVGDCSGNNVRAAPMRGAPPGSDGVRVIVLDLGSLSPIPDGMLYCCNLRIHPESGSCCPISIQNARSSNAKGDALSTVGRPGQVCLASAAGVGGRLEGGPGARQAPVVGADLGTGAPEPSGEAAPRAGGGILGAPPRPPAVVVPGGEPLAQAPPVEPIEEPTAAPEEEPAATVAPTAEKTADPTPEAAAVATPAAPTVAPRSPVVPPERAAETKRASEATPATRSGCHCQIGATGDGWSILTLVLSVPVILWARRRRL